MLIGIKKLQKLGLKKWVFVPKDVYIHKKFGKVYITDVQPGKVCFSCRNGEDSEERTFLTKVFRRGIVDQIKEGGLHLKVGANFVERPVVKRLVLKSGLRIRLIIKNRVFIPD
jgi:hypothetical protein